MYQEDIIPAFSQHTFSSLKIPSKVKFMLSIGKIICHRSDFYTFYWQFLRHFLFQKLDTKHTLWAKFVAALSDIKKKKKSIHLTTKLFTLKS